MLYNASGIDYKVTNDSEQNMKDKVIMLVLLLIFLSLIGRLFYDKAKEETAVGIIGKIEYESLDELALFVTLENEVQLNKQGMVWMGGSSIWDHDITASINVDSGYVSDGDLSREPDYVHHYPNLYARSDAEYKSPSDGRKVCFLTFDDGPSANTLKVLDVLDEKKIKATFFVIGEEITEQNASILKEVVNRGHLIGVHTYVHDYDKIYKSVDSFLKDYDKAFQRIEEVTGVRPYIYRFPGGSYNQYLKRIRKELVAEMDRRGFTYYDWNVSGEDSVGSPTAYSIKKNISRDLNRYQCPVVLLHDGQTNPLTAKVLGGIIDYIESKGYEFDTLDHREPCQFRW